MEFGSSCDVEVDTALKRIEEEPSLNDDIIKELEPFLMNDQEWWGQQDYEGEVSARLHGFENYEYNQKHCEDNGLYGSPLHQVPGKVLVFRKLFKGGNKT